MALVAKDYGGGEDFAPIPSGLHPAICSAVIDIGTQPSLGNFPSKRKIIFLYELPNERVKITPKDQAPREIPRQISSKYTLSLSQKGNLRPALESWRGKAFTAEELAGFDLNKVLGAPCYLNITHKAGTGDKANRTYANIAAIVPYPKTNPKLSCAGQPWTFDLDAFLAKGGKERPDHMPEWIWALIVQSDEYMDAKHGTNPGQATPPPHENENIDEDVPF